MVRVRGRTTSETGTLITGPLEPPNPKSIVPELSPREHGTTTAPRLSSSNAPSSWKRTAAILSGRRVRVVPLSRMAGWAKSFGVSWSEPLEDVACREVKATVKEVTSPAMARHTKTFL